MNEYLVHVLQGPVGCLRVEEVYDGAKGEAEDTEHFDNVSKVN